MSERVFDRIEISSEFEISDDFVKNLLEYAIPQAVTDMSSYWRSERAEKIITDKTFLYLWTSYPSSRDELLELAIGIASGVRREALSLPQEFCRSFISSLYSLIDTPKEQVSAATAFTSLDFCEEKLRVKLLPIADKSFDYLKELCKHSLFEAGGESNRFRLWKNAGMHTSSDPAFYDYLWAKVKREPGSVDAKLTILSAADDNNALSDSLIKNIAKSSPKRIKRSITGILSASVNTLKHKRDRLSLECVGEAVPYGAASDLAAAKEMVDKAESKIMLFVDCTDRVVVSNLLGCLSKENLPWLMPSASKHYYLSRQLQQMLED